MAKFTAFKRLNAEDFNPKYKDLIVQLGEIFNPIMDQFTIAFNKNIDFENLAQTPRNLTLVVGADNKPLQQIQVSSGLTRRCRGIRVVRAVCLSDAGVFVNSAPFISFQENDGLITIQHISGLVPNQQYSLSLVFES